MDSWWHPFNSVDVHRHTQQGALARPLWLDVTGMSHSTTSSAATYRETVARGRAARMVVEEVMAMADMMREERRRREEGSLKSEVVL